ncbi:MAG: hypothetical protein ACKPB4_22205 [Sphaerospermopsis kisseleviana]
MSIGAVSKQNRAALLLAVAALAFILAVLWLKTGRVPAAAGGDEVWMGEGAHWLLVEGVHAYDFLADDHGHQVVSTFQPVSSVFYAIVFALFGMTPFTLMLQIPVVGTAAMVLCVAICRRLGLAWWLSLLVPSAIWGLMMVERRLNTVRWEPFVAVWVLLSFWCLLGAARRKGAYRVWLQGAAGVCSTLAGITYYPHAPFVLVALTGAAVILAGWSPLAGLPGRVAPYIVGGVLSGGMFLGWIFRNYEFFYKQVLAFGDEHYFRLGNLVWPFIALVNPEGLTEWIAIIEHLFVVGVAVFAVIALKDPRWRAAAWVAIVMCGPMFLYRKPVMDIAGGIFGVVVLAGVVVHTSAKLPRVAGYAALWLLAALAVGRFGLLGYTAYAQADRRSYSVFEEMLREALGPNHGKIASSQFTWLALRGEKGRGEYNFISKYGDPSYDYRSTVLRTREGIESHTHIIVAQGYENMIRKHYPEIQSAIDDGTLVKVADIVTPGPALPWAGAPIYDCTVYLNRKTLP